MDAFATGGLPQKKQIEIDVNKEKSGRKKIKKYDSNLNFGLQSQKGKALSIRNVLFVAKF